MDHANKPSISWKIVVTLGFAIVGWALCGASMGIGMATTTIDNALIIHAAIAPLVFGLLSWMYQRRFRFFSPLATASIFLGTVIFLDVTVVAMMINKSFEMFLSLLGTWIPFGLLFTSTYLAGITAHHVGESSSSPPKAQEGERKGAFE